VNRLLFAVAVVASASAGHAKPVVSVEQRLAILNRARVRVAPSPPGELRRGPSGPGAFAPGATVACDYVGRPRTGRSPKFTCALSADDSVKVKYGRENGEIYAEVAATRLLSRLGFAADRMYPVIVECRGCPKGLGGRPAGDGRTFVFDEAVIERPFHGREIDLAGRRGWDWAEIDIPKASAGGATRAERDALKLLAVMLQHTDSKSEQQRLICPDPACEHPVAMINDLGLTFGRASLYNGAAPSSVNLEEWRKAGVWADRPGCVGNIRRSYTGTLDYPRIGEEGRRLLASLLDGLDDAELAALFEAAHFDRRSGTIAGWVEAFKAKRAAIDARRCDN
jgi:hypothetical protein